MIHKPKQPITHQQRRQRIVLGSYAFAIVFVIFAIIGIVIIGVPQLPLPSEEPEPTTSLDVAVKFTYTYPSRYTFWNSTSELLPAPYIEYGAVHYTFNLTCEGRWWNPTTRITPRINSRTSIILQFYYVNPEGYSNSFIDVLGALTVVRNATVIVFNDLRIVAHSYILNDPNDYWRCEITFEAMEYLTL